MHTRDGVCRDRVSWFRQGSGFRVRVQRKKWAREGQGTGGRTAKDRQASGLKVCARAHARESTHVVTEFFAL